MTAAKVYVFGIALLLAVVAVNAPSLSSPTKGALILLALAAAIVAGGGINRGRYNCAGRRLLG